MPLHEPDLYEDLFDDTSLEQRPSLGAILWPLAVGLVLFALALATFAMWRA